MKDTVLFVDWIILSWSLRPVFAFIMCIENILHHLLKSQKKELQIK